MSKVAKWIFPAAGGKDGIIGTVKAAVGFITGNGSLIAAGIAQVAGLGKRKDAGQDRQASVTNMSVGEVPREALLGRVCTGGSLIDAFNHGGQYGTDKVTRCIALCDHAIDAIEGFYVGDVYYAWAGNGAQSAFSNKLTLEFRNATATGYAPPSYAVSGGGWVATDRLCSVTHIWVTTDIDDKVWTQGHPQFRWVLRGLKVYDPRFDPALGYAGASPQTWENRASHTFSENAELLRYAYNRGIYAEGHHGDPAYLLIGRGLTAEEAPPSRVIASANLCAEVVSGKMRYAASAVVRAADEFIQVEEMFAAAMAGDIVQREGGIQVEPGQAKSPIYTITDADLVLGEPVSFSRFLPDGSEGRRNTVVPSYVEPAQGWKDHAGPVRRSIDDILADGGPRELPLSLPFVNDAAQADRNAEIARRLSRLERRAAIVLPPDYSPLEEGDWIAWQSDRYHAGATVRYRIDRWAQNEKWRMALTLREIASSVYGVPDPVSDASDPPPAPPVVAALSLSGVSGVAIQLGEGSELPGLRVAWATPDPAVRAILVEVREEGGGVAAPTRIDDVAALTKDVTNGVRAGTDLEFRLTPITDPTRAVTATAWLPVTAGDIVIAPGAPLPTVSGTPSIDIDTAIAGDGTEISTLSGSWTAVATASAYDVEIDDGVAPWVESMPTATIKNFRIATGRTYRYRVKAVNRDGVRSAAWSAWSDDVAAGGDTTAPNPLTSGSVTSLPRRLVLNWTCPTNDDYAGLHIFRGVSDPSVGTTPTYGATDPIPGTTFTDTNVLAGTTYNYWGRSVDRTGNFGAWTLIGGGTPGFITMGPGGGGGDVAPTDPDLVTGNGTSAFVFGQGTLATRNNVTAAMMPLLNAENDFTDEDFDSTLVNISVDSSFDTSSETTATMGIKRSLKSRSTVGLPLGSQIVLNTLSTTNLVKVTPGQSVRFNFRSLVKAGFTGLLRSFRYFVGPTGITIGAATIDTVVDRRGAAQVADQVYETESAPLLVPAGASHCYFVWFVDFSSSLTPAGYVLVGRPRLRRITDFGGLATDAVRFGGNVRRNDGLTLVNDADAITGLGTAALLAGQSILATLNIPYYASNAAAVAANEPNGLGYYNTTSGKLDTVVRAQGDNVGTIFATPSLSTVVGGNTIAWVLWDSKDVTGVPAGATIDPVSEASGAGTTSTPSASANFNIRITEQLLSGGAEITIAEGVVSIVSSDLDLGGGSYQVSASGGFNTRYNPATKSGDVRYRLYFQGFAGNDTSIGAYFTVILRIYS